MSKYVAGFVFASMILGAGWYGCNVPSEGCLDILATNFDPTADDNCCCTYPELVLNITHKVDTVNFNTTPVLHDNQGRTFTVNKVRMYLYDFKLYRADNSFEKVTDSLLIYFPDANNDLDSAYFNNSFALVSTSDYTNEIGSFKAQGTFTKMTFKVGIPDPINQADPLQFETTHPLYLQSEAMWDTLTGYYYDVIAIDKDTSASVSDPLGLVLFSTDNLVDVVVTFGTPIVAKEGHNLTIPLIIDYATLLKDIDTQDADQALAKIVANLPNAFRVE